MNAIRKNIANHKFCKRAKNINILILGLWFTPKMCKIKEDYKLKNKIS